MDTINLIRGTERKQTFKRERVLSIVRVHFAPEQFRQRLPMALLECPRGERLDHGKVFPEFSRLLAQLLGTGSGFRGIVVERLGELERGLPPLAHHLLDLIPLELLEFTMEPVLH